MQAICLPIASLLWLNSQVLSRPQHEKPWSLKVQKL